MEDEARRLEESKGKLYLAFRLRENMLVCSSAVRTYFELASKSRVELSPAK